MIKDNITRIYVAFFLNLFLCLFSLYTAISWYGVSTLRTVLPCFTAILFGVFTWFAVKRYKTYQANQSEK